MTLFGMRKRDLFKQFSKFTSVGVPAFAIDYGFLLFFTEIWHVDYLVSATASFMLSIIFQYYVSMRLVFKRKEDMRRSKAFAIFLGVSTVSLGLNDVFLYLASGVLAIDYRLAKIAVAAVVSLFSFSARKYLLEGHA